MYHINHWIQPLNILLSHSVNMNYTNLPPRYKQLKKLSENGSVRDIIRLGGCHYFDNLCFSVACVNSNRLVMEFFFENSKRSRYCAIERTFGECVIKHEFKSVAWLMEKYPLISYEHISQHLICLCKEGQLHIAKNIVALCTTIKPEIIDLTAKVAIKLKKWEFVELLYAFYPTNIVAKVDEMFNAFIDTTNINNIVMMFQKLKYIDFDKCVERSMKKFNFEVIETLVDLNPMKVCQNDSCDIVQFLITNFEYKLASKCINHSLTFNRDLRFVWAAKNLCLGKLKVDIQMNKNLTVVTEAKILPICIEHKELEMSAIWIIEHHIDEIDIDNIWLCASNQENFPIIQTLLDKGCFYNTKYIDCCLKLALRHNMIHLVLCILKSNPLLIPVIYQFSKNVRINEFCAKYKAHQEKFCKEVLVPILDSPIERVVRSVHNMKNKNKTYLLFDQTVSGSDKIIEELIIDTELPNVENVKSPLENSINARPFTPQDPMQIPLDTDEEMGFIPDVYISVKKLWYPIDETIECLCHDKKHPPMYQYKRSMQNMSPLASKPYRHPNYVEPKRNCLPEQQIQMFPEQIQYQTNEFRGHMQYQTQPCPPGFY